MIERGMLLRCDAIGCDVTEFVAAGGWNEIKVPAGWHVIDGNDYRGKWHAATCPAHMLPALNVHEDEQPQASPAFDGLR